MILEQVLECPVTGQVEIFRCGETLGVGVLFFFRHTVEPTVFFDEPPAMFVPLEV